MKKIILLILLVFIIDSCFFRYLLWQLPNESPWNINQLFNVLYQLNQAKEKKEKRILIIGSSIAYYSFIASNLQSYLQSKTNIKFEFIYIAFAGMTPFDVNMLADKIIQLEPDLIIYPVNFIDFRLHRPYLMGETNETVSSRTMLLEDSLNLVEAPQARYLYPGEVIRKYLFPLGAERSSEFISSFLFGFYRYRGIVNDYLAEMLNHRFGRNTSYHSYMGVQIPEKVSTRGWTGKRFTFHPTKKMAEEGIWLEVIPEIINASPLTIELISANSSQNIKRKELETRKEVFTFDTPGWKLIRSPLFSRARIISVTLSSVWEPYNASGFRFDYIHDKLGVRLQQTFGLESSSDSIFFKISEDKSFNREERIEDLRFIKMSDKDYKDYFYEYLLKDPEKRPGIAYLHSLKIAKENVANEQFRETFQFGNLQEFNKKMQSAQIKLIVINHPENPLSLAWYGTSEWYQGYLDFLKRLENLDAIDSIGISKKRNESEEKTKEILQSEFQEYGNSVSSTIFLDWKDRLSMRDFNDYHHITYGATLILNRILGEIILKKFMTKSSSHNLTVIEEEK